MIALVRPIANVASSENHRATSGIRNTMREAAPPVAGVETPTIELTVNPALS
jgi:hypothetical protein